MGSNSEKSSNDLYSETTGQIFMRLGHNDHLLNKNLNLIRGLRGGVKWNQIVLNRLTTSLKPPVKF